MSGSSRCFTRGPSPAQIRRAGERAFRNRMRGIYPVTMPAMPPVLRAAGPDETPLSPAEIEFAASKGFVRTSREVRS